MSAKDKQALELIEEAVKNNATELHLSFLGLSQLPHALFELVHLEELNLSGNELSSIPGEISTLKNLRVLDLAGNKISCLPNTLVELKKLERLDLASNQLSELPGNLVLSELCYLDCFSNHLTSLPASLTQCSQLKTLRLGENDLKRLPEGLGSLRALSLLDLGNNNLENLPVSIVRLTQLEELHLIGNLLDIPFQKITKWVYQPEKLLSYIATAKKQQMAESSDYAKEEKKRRVYTEKLNHWAEMLEDEIKRNDWHTDASLTMGLSEKTDLPSIITELHELSCQLSIVLYLTDNWGEQNHQKSQTLLAMLERRRQTGTQTSSLKELTINLPTMELDQLCNKVQLTTCVGERSSHLQFHIQCSSRLKQEVLAIFLSLCRRMNAPEHQDNTEFELIQDVVTRQLGKILLSGKNIEDAKNRISTGICLLAADVCAFKLH